MIIRIDSREAGWSPRFMNPGSRRETEDLYQPARPLNRLQPTRETVPALEQRGCLHANMDLYKWAFKLAPLTPAELTADCFELARDIREVDMRASPYDLRSLGYGPIAIETPLMTE